MERNEATLGEEIRRVRLKKGLTQKELATICGMYQVQISDIERGRYIPCLKHKMKIFECLGIEIEEPKTVGEKIKHARIRKGLTQKVLGELSNVDKREICKIEKGERKPNYATRFKIYKCLGLDLEKPKTMGEKMKIARAKKGLTQADLAEMCKTSKSHICEIENGRSVPTPELKIEIFKCLGLDLYI